MTQANDPRVLLLRTLEGLLLKFHHEPEWTVDRWTATLHLRPSRDTHAAGIKTGPEVARVWAEYPPRWLLTDVADRREHVSVFLGTTMFSLPRTEAAKLQAWLAGCAKIAEAC